MNDFLDNVIVDGLKPFKSDGTLMDQDEYFYALQCLYALLDEELHCYKDAIDASFEIESIQVILQKVGLELRHALIQSKHYHEQRLENS